MDFTIYAPVIIPTLNRYEHFKRCLDSLERCTWADQTDVYIGLDYPPSEKYVDGWMKIGAYLNEKEKSNGFKNLFVRRRDHNCGVGCPGSNGNLLLKEISAISDRYIFSEDDNEFSPNFLEYMNWGLCKYKDDMRVCAVCGYSFPLFGEKMESNCFLSPFSNAWGTGFWSNHKMEYAKKGSELYVLGVLESWKKSYSLYKKRSASLNGLLSMYFRKQYYGDVLKTTELLLSNKLCIFPTKSKVRNWGHDGTGVHCSTSNTYINQIIDEEFQFVCKEEPPIINIASKLDYGFTKRIAVLIRYIGYRLFGKDLMAFYWKGKEK